MIGFWKRSVLLCINTQGKMWLFCILWIFPCISIPLLHICRKQTFILISICVDLVFKTIIRSKFTSIASFHPFWDNAPTEMHLSGTWIVEEVYTSARPYVHTILFLILYRRQVVPLRQLPLVKCTLRNSLNYLPPVQY